MGGELSWELGGNEILWTDNELLEAGIAFCIENNLKMIECAITKDQVPHLLNALSDLGYIKDETSVKVPVDSHTSTIRSHSGKLWHRIKDEDVPELIEALGKLGFISEKVEEDLPAPWRPSGADNEVGSNNENVIAYAWATRYGDVVLEEEPPESIDYAIAWCPIMAGDPIPPHPHQLRTEADNDII